VIGVLPNWPLAPISFYQQWIEGIAKLFRAAISSFFLFGCLFWHDIFLFG
jgi:hypothetical protein